MKKNHRKLISIVLIASLLIAGCGAAKSEPAPVKEEAQTQVAEAPAAEEPAAETPAAEEQVTETQEATAAETSAPEPEAEKAPEEEAEIPEGSEITESELDDGTIRTEIIKPDGSIRLILEDPDGGKTVTNYDSQLYPRSKVVYDENGNKKSESTFNYDENQLDTSWEYTTEYDENGNVAYTSETESVYPVEEGFIYGAEPASGPDTIYPDPTGKGYKYGTELLPATSETTVKDAQGEIVKTISIDNEKREAMVEYPDGSKEHYSPIAVYVGEYEIKGAKNGVLKSIQINYYDPQGIRYKFISFYPGLGRNEIEYSPDGSVISRHSYDEDGNQIK